MNIKQFCSVLIIYVSNQCIYNHYLDSNDFEWLLNFLFDFTTTNRAYCLFRNMRNRYNENFMVKKCNAVQRFKTLN